MNNVFRLIIIAISWVFIQAFIFDEVTIAWWIKPLPYVYFLFLIPFDINKYGNLIIGYFFGLLVDAFSGSTGLHTTASLIAVFAKYFIDHYFFNLDSIQLQGHKTINERSVGVFTFYTYMFSIIFIHHFSYYLLDYFDFTRIFTVIFISIIASLFSGLVIIGSRILANR